MKHTTAISIKEYFASALIGMVLIIGTWGFAGETLSFQIAASLLSAASLVFGLVIQYYSFSGINKINAFDRCLKNPVLWFGLAVLLYITIQAINPAYDIEKTDFEQIHNYLWKFTNSFLLIPREHIDWLPSSIVSAFSDTSSWRTLMVFSGLFFFALSLFTLHKTRLIISVLVIAASNATVMALAGMLIRFSGSNKILGLFPGVRGATPFGPFNYVNQAAAFHCMGIALSFALFFYFQRRAQKYMLPSSPHPIFLVFAFLNIAAVGMTLSQGGIVIGGSILLAFFIILLARGIIEKHPGNFLIAISLLAIIPVAGFLTLGKRNIDALKNEIERLDKRTQHIDNDVRISAYRATFAMFEDKPVYGWGAGAFQFAFPQYQSAEPMLMKKGWWNQEMNYEGKPIRVSYPGFWVHAHNDWLELLAELGIAGMTLLMLPPLYFAYIVFSNLKLLRPFHIMLIVGCGGITIHAFFDTLFYSMGILLYFVTIAVSLATLIQRRRKYAD